MTSISFRKSFPCAGRTVYVVLSTLRSSDRLPVFETLWAPEPPTKFSPAEIAQFDRGRQRAILELKAELERMQ